MPPRPGPSPRRAVRLELLRAAGALALTPLRLLGFLASRRRARGEVLADLEAEAPAPPAESALELPDRPLRLFVSCAEPSGELHARSLVRALRRRLAATGAPDPVLLGLGGARLAAEGVELLGEPVAQAAMGLDGVGAALPYYLDLLETAAAALREREVDVCVPVDSPALHVPLGHLAHRYGVPVVHFVTPQYWGWAPWRVGGYRAAVDLALTILPFEPPWFARHGVTAAHVGHPLLDAMADVPATRPAPGATALALLPGSRESTVERNLPWMLAALGELRARRPELEVVLPHDRAELAPRLAALVADAGASGWVRIETGDLHASLARARAAFSVSGTILLDLLHHRLPAVVIYRLRDARQSWAYRNLLTTPWFASPNLLANREVLPEFCFHGRGPRTEVAAALERALDDEAWRADCLAGLDRAAERLGPPGAADRAAYQVLARAAGRKQALAGAPFWRRAPMESGEAEEAVRRV